MYLLGILLHTVCIVLVSLVLSCNEYSFNFFYQLSSAEPYPYFVHDIAYMRFKFSVSSFLCQFVFMHFFLFCYFLFLLHNFKHSCCFFVIIRNVNFLYQHHTFIFSQNKSSPPKDSPVLWCFSRVIH